MTSPDKDLVAEQGVDEESSTSTEELTGVQNPIRELLGDPPPSPQPTTEGDVAPPDDVQTARSREATGPGQQMEAGEG